MSHALRGWSRLLPSSDVDLLPASMDEENGASGNVTACPNQANAGKSVTSISVQIPFFLSASSQHLKSSTLSRNKNVRHSNSPFSRRYLVDRYRPSYQVSLLRRASSSWVRFLRKCASRAALWHASAVISV